MKAELARKGSAADMTGVPQDLKDLFVTALDIPPEQHVRIQAAFQKYTDNAVSKTVNLPESATVDDVLKVYNLAYDSGLQGRHRLSLRQQKPGALPGQWGDGAGVQVLRMKLQVCTILLVENTINNPSEGIQLSDFAKCDSKKVSHLLLDPQICLKVLKILTI